MQGWCMGVCIYVDGVWRCMINRDILDSQLLILHEMIQLRVCGLLFRHS